MENRLIAEHTAKVKAEAMRLGFQYCGVSKAGFLSEEAPRLEKWLSEGKHGTMGWMERNFDKRLDPTLLVDGAKSVISVLINYHSQIKQEEGAPKISTYAYGEDYHQVIKDKLKMLLQFIQCEIGEVAGRGFVDSAPVLDRAWAAKSGLGWVGKHSNLINKKDGSFFFLAELIVDLELETDQPMGDFCGTCTACIDACPTNAIVEPYFVDGSRCISYLTIELKEAIPLEFSDQMAGWVFGCDICQDVCPWNRFAKQHDEPAFQPNADLLQMTWSDWDELTEQTFGRILKKSAIRRTSFKGMKRNILFIQNKDS